MHTQCLLWDYNSEFTARKSDLCEKLILEYCCESLVLKKKVSFYSYALIWLKVIKHNIQLLFSYNMEQWI